MESLWSTLDKVIHVNSLTKKLWRYIIVEGVYQVDHAWYWITFFFYSYDIFHVFVGEGEGVGKGREELALQSAFKSIIYTWYKTLYIFLLHTFGICHYY